MKKEMAVAVAAAMCISLVGCGGGSSKKVVADKKEAVETTVAETTETETMETETTELPGTTAAVMETEITAVQADR